MKKYFINEIFYSLQGEGVRAGVPHTFVRFSGCNLQCSADDPESGFDCDTEFTSGNPMTAADVVKEIKRISDGCKNVCLTGGEPTLQVNAELIAALRKEGFWLALETNGTKQVPLDWFEWIAVSPKSADHTIRQRICCEVKYVRNVGQAIPKTSIEADHYLISPAFVPDGSVSPETLRHCINLVKLNPRWRLSVQQHKLWKIR